MNWDDAMESLADGKFIARPHWPEGDKLFAIGWSWVPYRAGDIGLLTSSGLELYDLTSSDIEVDDWHEVP